MSQLISVTTPDSATPVTPGRSRAGLWRKASTVALVLLLLVVPFVNSEFRNSQFTLVIVYAVATLGLNLLVGYSGQVSLGHGAFFAVGAYTTAILMMEADVPYLLALVAAGALTFVAGFLFGIPTLRVRGLYLALLTLGLSVAVQPLAKRFTGLTGGTSGLVVPQPQVPSWLSGLAQDQFLYLLCLAVALVVFLLIRNLVQGRIGRALVTIRDAEIVAKSNGVAVSTYKTLTFATSSGVAGIAGALYVFTVGFVAPESFTLLLSISFLTAVVIGGLATIGGAVLGALFIVFVPEYASEVHQSLSGVVYGALLILFMYFLPHGGMGLLRRLGARVATRTQGDAQ